METSKGLLGSNLSVRAAAVLVECVDRQAAEQLGIEIGGLLRHNVAGQRNVTKLIQRDGLDQEGNVGLTRLHLLDGLRRLAEKVDVPELRDALLREAENLVQQDGVELDHIELRLAV